MSDSVEAAIQRAAAGAAAMGPATPIVIKEDRSIVVPTAMQQIAVQCDNEANVLHFVCPRNWADIDLAAAVLYINVVKPDKSIVAFTCTNVVSSEDTVTFDWVVTEPVTDIAGKLSFLVCARDPSDPGDGYRWHSNLCDSLFIAPGIVCTVPSDTPDPPHIPLYGTDTTLTEPSIPADAKATGDAIRSLSNEIANGVSWNELKDKPFYLEKTLVVELTKNDFVLDNAGHPFYTSSPKLDWMTSIDNVSIELNLVYNDGTSYVITENSPGIYFETLREADGREYVYFGDDENIDIYSGPEDSFSIKIWGSYENLTEIHLTLYRVDIKKIPGILVDAAIGKTALNVEGLTSDETTGEDVLVAVPAINIPVDSSDVSENEVFYDTKKERLTFPAKIIPWNGTCKIGLNYALSDAIGNDMPFSLKEGDAEWEYLNHAGGKYTELLFYFIPSALYLSFLVKKRGSRTVAALAISEVGYVYRLTYTYSTDYKTINGWIRRIL